MRRIILICLLSFLTLSASQNGSVTVYVSQDQVFSEPILKDFEKETGIKVKAVYDSEESKSTGVMNRLLAEKRNPQADIYWANEPIRAEVLRNKGVLAPYMSPNAKGIDKIFKSSDNTWCGFSARIRLFVVHKDTLMKPHSVMDYANSALKGKGVIANPLFGTTTSHISALFTHLGEKTAKAFMEKMKDNKIAISTSNGESADFVASGKYDFSLVDSDDAISRFRAGKPIEFIYPDQKDTQMGVFVVPNAVMLIKGARHPENAKKLFDYLLAKDTEAKLAKADCAQIPLHKGVEGPKELKPISDLKVMQVDYAKVAKKLVKIQPYLKAWLAK